MTVMSQRTPNQPNENSKQKEVRGSSTRTIKKESTVITSENEKSVKEHCKHIDYLKSDKPFVVARFILECGSKLEAKVITISTAHKLFHKFNQSTQGSVYDPYLMSSACLYLAGKIEDSDHLRLRDIINVVYSTLHRKR